MGEVLHRASERVTVSSWMEAETVEIVVGGELIDVRPIRTIAIH